MQDMHAAGLAHCDIKPSNIVLTHDGTAKVADFGAACDIDPCTGILSAVNMRDSLAAMNNQDDSIERLFSSCSKDGDVPCTPSKSGVLSQPNNQASLASLSGKHETAFRCDSDRAGINTCLDNETLEKCSSVSGVRDETTTPRSGPLSLMLTLPSSLQWVAASQLSLSPWNDTQVQNEGHPPPFQGVGSLWNENIPVGRRRSSGATALSGSLNGTVRYSKSSSLRDVPMVRFFTPASLPHSCVQTMCFRWIVSAAMCSQPACDAVHVPVQLS